MDLSDVVKTIEAELSREQLMNYLGNEPLNERWPSTSLLSKLWTSHGLKSQFQREEREET